MFSSNASGKTAALIQEVNWAATGYNPILKKRTKAPCKIVVVLDASDKIGEVFLPEYRKWFDLPDEWCKKNGKPYIQEIHFPNGSQVTFYSAESDPMRFEGFMCDYAYIDEPLPRQLMIALRRSLRIKGSPAKLLFIGTCVSQPWLRTEIYEPWSKGESPGVECFRVGVEANRNNLEEGYIERFSRGLSEAEKATRLQGAFFDSDAVALGHLWKREQHVYPAEKFHYDKKWPCVVAVDPHTSKPHTAIMITSPKEDRIIAIKELKVKGNATDFSKELKEWMKGYTVIDIVCDSAGNAQGTALEGFDSFISAVRNNGIQIRPTMFKEKNHEDLLGRLQNGLDIPDKPDQFGRTIPKLRVLSTLTSLIRDIESASWQKNRYTGDIIPKIDTSIKDHLSCLGYALATGLFRDKMEQSRPVYRDDVAPEVTGTPKEVEQRRHSIIAGRSTRLLRKAIGRHRR